MTGGRVVSSLRFSTVEFPCQMPNEDTTLLSPRAAGRVDWEAGRVTVMRRYVSARLILANIVDGFWGTFMGLSTAGLILSRFDPHVCFEWVAIIWAVAASIGGAMALGWGVQQSLNFKFSRVALVAIPAAIGTFIGAYICFGLWHHGPFSMVP